LLFLLLLCHAVMQQEAPNQKPRRWWHWLGGDTCLAPQLLRRWDQEVHSWRQALAKR
jgi:hypothetical protein